jgi:RimJ/RimL family protein N-acetyltransferase
MLSEEAIAISTATGAASQKGVYISYPNNRIGPLKTKRLLLREFDIPDISAFHALESQEEVVRYQDYSTRTVLEAEALVRRTMRQSFEVPRMVYELAVEHEGEFIGRIGAFFDYEASVKYLDTASSSEEGEGEYGVAEQNTDGKGEKMTNVSLWFAFLPSSQGKGFATEAMQAFIPLLGAPRRLEIECDPRNTGSWKMAERLGFKRISLTKRAYE